MIGSHVVVAAARLGLVDQSAGHCARAVEHASRGGQIGRTASRRHARYDAHVDVVERIGALSSVRTATCTTTSGAATTTTGAGRRLLGGGGSGGGRGRLLILALDEVVLLGQAVAGADAVVYPLGLDDGDLPEARVVVLDALGLVAHEVGGRAAEQVAAVRAALGLDEAAQLVLLGLVDARRAYHVLVEDRALVSQEARIAAMHVSLYGCCCCCCWF